MSYIARIHYATNDIVPASDYNQGIDNEIELAIGGVSFPFDNLGADIEVNTRYIFDIPYKCKINRARVLVTSVADATYNFKVDIRRKTYSSFDGSYASGNSICGAAFPNVANVMKSEDSTLTGWSPDVAAGDTFEMIVTECTDVFRATISLKWSRT